MSLLRGCLLVAVGALPLMAHAGGASNQAGGKNTWARIVVDLVTPEINRKALEAQQFAVVEPDAELNFDVKKLGAEGRFSMKALQEKYGPPAKAEPFATREDGQVVAYRALHYPPLTFTVPVGGDQPKTIGGPKRVWAGDGILGHAEAALKEK